MPDASEKSEGHVAKRSVGREGHDGAQRGYVIPLLHTTVPEALVNLGFWGTLGASVLLGAVDAPLGALIGAGVIVARHSGRKR